MSYKPTYKAANTISATIEQHFVKLHKNAIAQGEVDLATQPNKNIIEAIIDVAFWSSLRKEEGHSPRISIAFLPPSQTSNPLHFAKRLALNANTLTKIAPGIERSGIHLGVWEEDGELYIWGTTLNIPNFCFVVDVSEPGLIVIKHRRIYGIGKFTNVAVLKGEQIRIVDDTSCTNRDCPPILKALLDLTVLASWNDPINILIQFAVSMRAHGRGGALLIVPKGDEKWAESIIHPIQYLVEPPFNGLSNLAKQGGNQTEIFSQGAVRREVEHLAGLTAVDGATIINEEFDLIAFGAKIGRAKGKPTVEQIAFSEPIVGGEDKILYPGQLGGTRHFSVAQFVNDQPQAIGLVASQDGHFTIFSWSNKQDMVMAHRIETLLL
ncbi:putative sensor domain DACNV-containing protein [Pedobacter jamesrossensis]|uniref:Sensor domain DACNV-containing protein n=1 Tax=Pedobacter jamesrossensis TaxID=1908238 RepID=A0ABV8NK12_9SPHI